ncbi:KTSC domain-containing protein [Sinomonas albida]|uniref:KTSC domain-containing protein n=1 Tax=Sinomonas albida TaxID=369942 RepID=UPI0010A8FEC0|nr:KTSC domain-containing protein [Sinomonas albida]
MTMTPVVSTNVERVGYDEVAQILRVEFRSGGIYDYHGVARWLFDEMLSPYPWRRVGRIVMAHRCYRIG